MLTQSATSPPIWSTSSIRLTSATGNISPRGWKKRLWNQRLNTGGRYVARSRCPGIHAFTYDRRTSPPLLKTWAEEERTHGGVIFVDERTISPADIGGLVWALTRLAKETGNWDWTNRIYFLRR